MTKEQEQEFITLAKKLVQGTKVQRTRGTKVVVLEVDIIWEDLYLILTDQKFKCALSGVDLIPGYGKIRHPLYEAYHPLAPSLDRINDDIGYRKDNVRIILRLLNLGLSAYKGDEGAVLKTLGLSS